MKIPSRVIAFLVVFCTLGSIVHGQDLNSVLERAQAYVATYEQQLGTLIASEEYVQNAAWRGAVAGAPAGAISPGRGGVSAASSGRRQQRRLVSDFLLVRIGTAWLAMRNVLRVDGVRSETQTTLTPDFTESAQAVEAVIKENARYNIGDFQRTVNVPTFALTVLRKDNLDRFSFEKASDKEIDKVDTWEIRFQEKVHPTLVQGANGEDRFAHGKLWIDPDTGKILRTEIVFEGKNGGAKYQAAMMVSYEASDKLSMLVPAMMEERYDSEFHTIESRADYSNFQRFKVEVNAEIKQDSPQ